MESLSTPIVGRKEQQWCGEIKAPAPRFMALFDGLDRASGTYNINAMREDGKHEGKAETKKEPVTLQLWERHLEGQQGIGIVPIRDDSTVRFGAVHIDAYVGLDTKAIIARLAKMQVPAVVCRSKSGGAHI